MGSSRNVPSQKFVSNRQRPANDTRKMNEEIFIFSGAKGSNVALDEKGMKDLQKELSTLYIVNEMDLKCVAYFSLF